MSARKRVVGSIASPRRPLIAAHRGSGLLWTENSLAAFRNVLVLGADCLELDVHLTRDGELAVIHDPMLDRTTTGHGAVGEKSWAQLRRCVLTGTAREHIPRLGEVLELLRKTDAGLFIEVKTGPHRRRYAGIEKTLVRAIDEAWLADRVTITAFEWDTLERVQRLTGNLRLAGVLSRRRARALGGVGGALRRLLGLVKATDLAIEHTLLSEETPGLVHEAGLALGVWTPNSRDALARVLAAGPDWVITDRPDVALELRAGITMRAGLGT